MTEQEHNNLWEEYFYPGTEILVNKLDIKNEKQLKTAEATYTLEKLLELSKDTLDGEIDKNRLNIIHEYLFKDIYPFAGKYRKVNMMKKEGTFLNINKPSDIDSNLETLFSEINTMLKYCHSKDEFSDILAKLYTSLIYIHPYREGNGRTIREFLREFSIKKSKELGIGELELNWEYINKEELDKYISIAHILPGHIASMFLKALESNNNVKNR